MPAHRTFGERFGVIDVLKRDEGSVVGWVHDRESGRRQLVRRLVDSVRGEDFAREALEAEAAYAKRLDVERGPRPQVIELPDGEVCLLYSGTSGCVLERILHGLDASDRTLTQSAAMVVVSGVLRTAKAIQRVRARALTGASLWGHGEIEPRSIIIDPGGEAHLFDVRYAATGLLSGPSPISRLCRAPELSEAAPTGSPAGDVFAVGALLALAILGPRRLINSTPDDLARVVAKELAERKDDIDDGFGFVMTTALAPRSRDRFENSNVMRIALRQCAYLDNDAWDAQQRGLGELAQLFAGEERPARVPEELFERHPRLALMDEAPDPTLATFPTQGDDAEREVAEAMGALGLPGGAAPTEPRPALSSDARGVIAAISESDFPSAQGDDTRETAASLAYAAAPTRLLFQPQSTAVEVPPKTDALSSQGTLDGEEEDASQIPTAELSAPFDAPNTLLEEPAPTIETPALRESDLADRLAARVETLSPDDLKLDTVDAELLGESSRSFESVTDELKNPSARELGIGSEPDFGDEALAGETSKAFDSTTDERSKPDDSDVGRIPTLALTPELPSVPSFDEIIPTGSGAVPLVRATSAADLAASVPERRTNRPKTGEARIQKTSSTPLRSAANAPIADEFDDDSFAADLGGRRAALRAPTGISEVGEGDVEVPSIAARIPNLSTGPLLAEALEEAVRDQRNTEAPVGDLPTPLRPAAGGRARVPAKLVEVPKKTPTLRLLSAPDLPLEALDPDVTPLIARARPATTLGTPRTSRPPPARRGATSTRPPPKLETESPGGRIAFLALAVLIIGASAMLLLRDGEPTPDAGAGVGVTVAAAPEPTRGVPEPRVQIIDERGTARTDAPVADPPTPPPTEPSADEDAARTSYGETDPLAAAGSYAPDRRREALGIWRLEPERPTDYEVVEEDQAYEEAVAYAPAYVPAARFGGEDDGFGGSEGVVLDQGPSPYVWGGPATAGAARAGKLVINVIPWGVVFIDGRSYGYPPVVVRWLTAGEHTVRVERPGFEPEEHTVRLGSGEDKQMHIRMFRVGERQ